MISTRLFFFFLELKNVIFVIFPQTRSFFGGKGWRIFFPPNFVIITFHHGSLIKEPCVSLTKKSDFTSNEFCNIPGGGPKARKKSNCWTLVGFGRREIEYMQALCIYNTECPKSYRKSVLHILRYIAYLYLNRCITDLW